MGYIDGGMIILDIADKANPKMVSRSGLSPAQPRLHPYGRAVLRARPLGGQRRGDPQRRRRLAQAGVDSSTTAPKKTRCRSRPCHCRRSRPSRGAAAASARIIFGRTSPEGRLLEVRHDRPRHLLQRRPQGVRPVEPVPAEGGRAFRAAAGRNARRPARADQRRVRRRPRRSCSASTATSAASTRSKWIFRGWVIAGHIPSQDGVALFALCPGYIARLAPDPNKSGLRGTRFAAAR